MIKTGIQTAPPPTLVLPKIYTANEQFVVRPPISDNELYAKSLPPVLRGRPPGGLLPPLAEDGEPWAPCLCQLCSCGQHGCPDVTPLPPPDTEYAEKYVEKEFDEPAKVAPPVNNWWPRWWPEDMRLQTDYRNKYRDWKQKPYFVNKKDIYVPPKAQFKSDSEYESHFQFPTPIDVLAKAYEPMKEKDLVKLRGPLASTYGWDYVDFPPEWKKAAEPRSAAFLQQKIWDNPLKIGYTTSRPFDGETTYIHDYVWFDRFGRAHPYPCPDPYFTPASVPRPFLPWLPLTKSDYPHWKGVKPPESWKPNVPYSPSPFPLSKRTTNNTDYTDWTKCGPDGIGRKKIPVVCMECKHEIRVPPEMTTNYQMDFREYNPLWFCKDIDCLMKREEDPCRDPKKEKCIELCDQKDAHEEYLRSLPPSKAFSLDNPFRPKENKPSPDGLDPIRFMKYEPYDPKKQRQIPCAADMVLSGLRNAKPIGKTACPQTGHLYICPKDVEKLLAEELNIVKRYPFRSWSKGDLDIEVLKKDTFKLMEATGGTRG